MNQNIKNYTVINTTIEGVLIQVDNGDTQYLTTEEYNKFLENRQKL